MPTFDSSIFFIAFLPDFILLPFLYHFKFNLHPVSSLLRWADTSLVYPSVFLSDTNNIINFPPHLTKGIISSLFKVFYDFTSVFLLTRG